MELKISSPFYEFDKAVLMSQILQEEVENDFYIQNLFLESLPYLYEEDNNVQNTNATNYSQNNVNGANNSNTNNVNTQNNNRVSQSAANPQQVNKPKEGILSRIAKAIASLFNGLINGIRNLFGVGENPTEQDFANRINPNNHVQPVGEIQKEADQIHEEGSKLLGDLMRQGQVPDTAIGKLQKALNDFQNKKRFKAGLNAAAALASYHWSFIQTKAKLAALEKKAGAIDIDDNMNPNGKRQAATIFNVLQQTFRFATSSVSDALREATGSK